MSCNGTPFAVFCPDGLVPALTLAAITDGKETNRAALVGKGSKNDVLNLIAALMPPILEAGIDVAHIAMAVAVGMEQAREQGIEFEQGFEFGSDFECDDENDDDEADV